MVSRTHVTFKADDRSYFAILKKDIHALAKEALFPTGRIGEIDIVVSEMVSNLVKHAGGGELHVKLIESNGVQGIELISVDKGPGMADVTRMVADGVSTKNTLGQGLGAMKRLSDVFQVYSLKDWGTIVLVRIFSEKFTSRVKPPLAEVNSLVLPKPGEKECGDGFFIDITPKYIKLFLGDGLGHGPEAAKAVTTAGASFMACHETDPVDIIRSINNEVKKTRGLVGTVAVFDLAEKCWRICGVGNIMTKIISPTLPKNLLAYNGIIGLNVPRTLNHQEIPYEKGQQIIMCSDGLKSKWDTIRYPAIYRYDLSILCAALIKDAARLTDDMSVACCKINL
jgi:anti-sigma regulatory factor (Ser/Thr protein kinase)